MAYDAVHGEVLTFGGSGSATSTVSLSDTWVWDGNTWTQRFPSTIPTTPRWNYALAFYPPDQRAILFGGATPDGSTVRGDTWTWDGTVWAQLSAGSPGGRAGHAMAYDAAHEQIVLFGGGSGSGDTWVLGQLFIHPVEPWAKSVGGYVFGDDWSDCSCDEQPFKHVGFDAQADVGDPVVAAAAGVVKRVIPDSDPSVGGAVVLEHTISGEKVTTVYWHVYPDEIGLREGDSVQQGDVIAVISPITRGPHLHFGFRRAPFDPSVSIRGALPQKTGCPACADGLPLPAFPEKWENPLSLFQ
jgi:murein DD-endopeptidase MepM/ murein hydrolase activator NlpD